MLIKVSSMYFWNPPDDMENPHQTEIDGYETFFLRGESVGEMLRRSGFVDCGVGCFDIWIHLMVDSPKEETHVLNLKGWNTELCYLCCDKEPVTIFLDTDLLSLDKVTPDMLLELIEDTEREVTLLKLKEEKVRRGL